MQHNIILSNSVETLVRAGNSLWLKLWLKSLVNKKTAKKTKAERLTEKVRKKKVRIERSKEKG